MCLCVCVYVCVCVFVCAREGLAVEAGELQVLRNPALALGNLVCVFVCVRACVCWCVGVGVWVGVGGFRGLNIGRGDVRFSPLRPVISASALGVDVGVCAFALRVRACLRAPVGVIAAYTQTHTRTHPSVAPTQTACARSSPGGRVVRLP